MITSPHLRDRRSPKGPRVLLVLLALAGLGGSAWACPPLVAKAGAVRLQPCHREQALREIEQAITAHYVFVELRAPLVAKLRAAERQRRYDVTDPELLAERVTQDLQEVSRDGHLYLKHAAEEHAALLAPPASDAGIERLRRSQAIRMNHGLVEQRILPGNVRYLKVAAFKWVADGSSARAYEEAARFLGEGDAAVIDLRGNGGGESDAADTFLRRLVGQRAGATGEAAAAGAPPRLLYFLIDGDVGSAAEAVSYDAKLRKTAMLVGATTYGAANNNKRLPIAPRFVLSVSYHRPVHPLSGTNWEGKGVAPDLAVAPPQALDAAHAEALRQLLARAEPNAPTKALYAWNLAALEARLQPPLVPEEHLRRLQGRYGPVELRYEGGALKLYRPDRPRWPQGARLSPMTEDGLFSLAETDELRLRVQPTQLELLRPGAAPERYPIAK